jgi:membrane-associated phospholipid phosphatase
VTVPGEDQGGAAYPPATDGAGPGGSTPRVPRPLLLTHGIWQPRSLLRFAAAGAVMAALWTVVGLLLVRLGPPVLDLTALEAAVDRQSPTLVSWARFASWVGDLPVVSAVTLVVVAIAYWRSRRWDLGWLSLAVIGGALAVTATIKLLTDRVRPDGGLTDTLSSAFPSGHAVRAAAVYTLVAWLVVRWTSPHRRAARIATVATAVTMVLAIGVSRLLLAAHWLSDVVGGYLLGVLWVAVCVAVTRPHRVGRAEVASTATASGAGVDDERQDRPDAVPPPQEPGGHGQGPARPADGVDQQHRSGR